MQSSGTAGGAARRCRRRPGTARATRSSAAAASSTVTPAAARSRAGKGTATFARTLATRLGCAAKATRRATSATSAACGTSRTRSSASKRRSSELASSGPQSTRPGPRRSTSRRPSRSSPTRRRCPSTSGSPTGLMRSSRQSCARSCSERRGGRARAGAEGGQASPAAHPLSLSEPPAASHNEGVDAVDCSRAVLEPCFRASRPRRAETDPIGSPRPIGSVGRRGGGADRFLSPCAHTALLARQRARPDSSAQPAHRPPLLADPPSPARPPSSRVVPTTTRPVEMPALSQLDVAAGNALLLSALPSSLHAHANGSSEHLDSILRPLSTATRRGSHSSARSSFASWAASRPLSPAESVFSQLYPPPPHLPGLTPSPTPPRNLSPSRPARTPPKVAPVLELTPAAAMSPSEPDPPRPAACEPLPTTELLGTLKVRVVEAKGLAVPDSQVAKPYVLLQYDRTDSVSREWGAPPPEERSEQQKKKGVRRKDAPTNGKGEVTRRRVVGGASDRSAASSSSTAVPTPISSAFSSNRSTAEANPPAIASLASVDVRPPKPPPLLPSNSHTLRPIDPSLPDGDPSVIGTPSSPIWNHTATFDVVSPGRTILLCVYDRLAPQGGPAGRLHGFLGACLFLPPLLGLEGEEVDRGEDGEGLDVWVPVTSALDSSVGGEIRLRLLFEPLLSRPKLTVDDFQILRRIGQGSFGQVFRVRKRDTKRIYAMKVIRKASVTTPEALAQVIAERQVLARTTDSPFLIGLKFSFQSDNELFLVIDYKSGGEVFQHLQRDGGRFDEAKVRFYVAEIILALEYLHDNNIVYRDLKPENCLLDGSGHVVLCDFGLSKLLDTPDGKCRTLCGTTAFVAPEVLLDVGYSFPADWWSLGVLLFEMCFGWSPFYAESRIEEYERILEGEIRIPNKKGYGPELRDLLLKLLERDPEKRLGSDGGASAIKAHPFFAPIDWTKLSLRQVSPPYKPPTHADDDQPDYYDQGGSWCFSEEAPGGCWQTPPGTSGSSGATGLGASDSSSSRRPSSARCSSANLIRGFTWLGKDAAGAAKAAQARREERSAESSSPIKGTASRCPVERVHNGVDTRRSSCA